MPQVLAMAQACKKIIMATTYTKSNLYSVIAFIPQLVCSFTYYFNIQQTPKSLMLYTWPRLTKHTAIINNPLQVFVPVGIVLPTPAYNLFHSLTGIYMFAPS